MSKITPNVLRRAAEIVDKGEEFMCFAMQTVSKSSEVWWKFEDMLAENGVSYGGGLSYRVAKAGRIAPEYIQNKASPAVKKQERVLFLLFLAEALEKP